MKEQLKKADVLGLILVASALISWFIRKTWTNYQTGVVIAGALLIVISLVLKSNDIRATMGRRSTKFGINSAISVVLLIGVLALVNYLGEKHQKRFDFTTERLHSLSDESVKVAREVKQDIRVKAFYPGGEHRPTQELLALYTNQNARISVEFIDPDKQPQVAGQYQPKYGAPSNPLTGQRRVFGTLILEMGPGKTERIEKQDDATEEDVTNALMKLVKGEKKIVYFVGGHGEKAIDSTERTGYQVADGELTKAGYTVKPLNLVTEQAVPADASVVVMAGPVTEPFSQEMDKLDAYLNTGGSVLLLLDPPPSASLTDFTKKWSVDVGVNRIIETSGMSQLLGTGPQVPLVSSWGNHKIVEGFANTMSFFPLARSVSPAKTPVPGLDVEPLIQSSASSWGESDLKSNEVGFDPKTDMKGPVPIATVVSKAAAQGKKTRLVVFGDSDFAINQYFGAYGNGNLFVNTVRWLAQDENFISIKAKSPKDRPLTMTESSGRTVGFLVVILFPVAVLFSGVLVWVRRRR